jgi:tetratricopeptide (TPR) repeat protein
LVFWATLLFAVHPLALYAATWISGRQQSLCTLFGVLALVALGRAAADGARAQGPWPKLAGWMVLSAAALGLSVGSKELGYVVPLAGVALFCPPLRVAGDPAAGRLRAVRLLGLGVLWASAALLATYRIVVVGAWGLAALHPTDSLLRNTAMAAKLWWHYVARILVPYEPRLSDAWRVVDRIAAGEVAAMLGVVGLLGVLAYAAYRRWPFAVALLWYVVWMLPATGLVALRHVRAERYLYPAYWGLLLAVLMLFLPSTAQVDSRRPSRAPSLVLSIIALWLILTTAHANTYWWNDIRLFSHSLEQDERHLEGRLAWARIALEQNDYRQAAEHCRRVIKDMADPTFVAYVVPYGAHLNLGIALLQTQSVTNAYREFQTCLRLKPASAKAHHYAGLAASAMGQPKLAKWHYTRALERDPDDATCRHNLSVTLLQLGEAQACVDLLGGRMAETTADLSLLRTYSAALVLLGRFAEAAPLLEQLIARQPDEPLHLARLAWCQWELGRHDTAQDTLDRARQALPDHPLVRKVARLMADGAAGPESGPPAAPPDRPLPVAPPEADP